IPPGGQYTERVLLPTLTENFVGCCTGRSAGLSLPRNGSQCRARLEFCAGSGRRKGRGLGEIRGLPLPCVTSVSTTSNLGLPRSVTSLGQSTLTLVLEGMLRRRIPQRRCACFLEQSSLFPRT